VCLCVCVIERENDNIEREKIFTYTCIGGPRETGKNSPISTLNLMLSLHIKHTVTLCKMSELSLV